MFYCSLYIRKPVSADPSEVERDRTRKLGGLPPIRDPALSVTNQPSIGHQSGINRTQNGRLQIVPDAFFRKKKTHLTPYFSR